jgi:hypothetical protein
MALTARLRVKVGDRATVDADEVRTVHEELRAALDRFEETTAQRLLERLFGAHSRLAVLRDVLLPPFATSASAGPRVASTWRRSISRAPSWRRGWQWRVAGTAAASAVS